MIRARTSVRGKHVSCSAKPADFRPRYQVGVFERLILGGSSITIHNQEVPLMILFLVI